MKIIKFKFNKRENKVEHPCKREKYGYLCESEFACVKNNLSNIVLYDRDALYNSIHTYIFVYVFSIVSRIKLS